MLDVAIQAALAQAAFKLFLALVAIGFGGIALYFAEDVISSRFDWLEDANATAKAVFYSACILGFCIAVGFALS